MSAGSPKGAHSISTSVDAITLNFSGELPRSDPNLVPLKKSSKLQGQKLRSNVPLFGLFEDAFLMQLKSNVQ